MGYDALALILPGTLDTVKTGFKDSRGQVKRKFELGIPNPNESNSKKEGKKWI